VPGLLGGPADDGPAEQPGHGRPRFVREAQRPQPSAAHALLAAPRVAGGGDAERARARRDGWHLRRRAGNRADGTGPFGNTSRRPRRDPFHARPRNRAPCHALHDRTVDLAGAWRDTRADAGPHAEHDAEHDANRPRARRYGARRDGDPAVDDAGAGGGRRRPAADRVGERGRRLARRRAVTRGRCDRRVPRLGARRFDRVDRLRDGVGEDLATALGDEHVVLDPDAANVGERGEAPAIEAVASDARERRVVEDGR